MKQKSNRDLSAFTFVEVVVLIAIIALLALFYLPTVSNRGGPHHYVDRISCVNNLKEIGTAYHIWAADHGDLFPSQQTVATNGWRDFLTNANQGAMCWTNFAIMADELGQSPKLLICPSDERRPALDFTNKLDNTNVSYFVGVSANVNKPDSIQGGDRNLGSGAVPATNYGYSPKSGKGNDVAMPMSGPVSWTLQMHSEGNTAGGGNILLGDGSSQQVSTKSFNQTWLRNAAPTTNWPADHIPATPSIRLVFP